MNYLYVILGINLLIGGFYILLNLPADNKQKRIEGGVELIQDGISNPTDSMKGLQAFLFMFLGGIGLVIYGLAQIFDWKINSN